MMKLTKEQWEKTAVFMQTSARPLEQALFNYHFGAGSVTAVFAALAVFQNEDSGFGHGLEPDMQVADSSVLATTVALQTLRALAVPGTNPLVQGAVRFLQNTYSPAHQSWPFVPPNVAEAPHAPWWQYDADYTQYWHNPRPEVVGYLLDWGDSALGAQVLTAVLATAAQAESIDMHALYCYLRLLETAALPDDARRTLTPLVQKWADQLVETNPDNWGGYGLRPLAVAATPDALLANHFIDAINQELDYVVREQQADGAWWPAWSWSDLYPDVWPQAAQSWKGVITLHNLLTLRAFGRLPDGVGQ
ncbi:MAG: hypothetical protein KC421_19130 [Anaerolineales bacterium]|nr:hypothetical protein [Anaerolineales bacterium]